MMPASSHARGYPAPSPDPPGLKKAPHCDAFPSMLTPFGVYIMS
ncbi:MAG TPA: hypothetical protein VIJ12_09230 [Candidatus Baltobacteraceae bacterium]